MHVTAGKGGERAAVEAVYERDGHCGHYQDHAEAEIYGIDAVEAVRHEHLPYHEHAHGEADERAYAGAPGEEHEQYDEQRREHQLGGDPVVVYH